jgi:hypothetical protein
MAELRLHQLPDGDLEAALRGLAPSVAWPATTMTSGSDIAAAVRARVEAMPVPGGNGRLTIAGLSGPFSWSWRPARRALVLALVALLAVVAIAGALGLGLPGLRFILGGAPLLPSVSAEPSMVAPSPSRAPGPLGTSLRLGEALDPADRSALDERAGFPVLTPADPAIGPPETAWIDDAKGGQVTLLWPARPGLPATLQPDVGLLISQFRGTVGREFFVKATGSDTVIEPVQVGGQDGYWLTGDPHIFFWEGQGGFVDDPRRWVGDVLLWSDGVVTYRLEASLGRDEAIRIAESMR